MKRRRHLTTALSCLLLIVAAVVVISLWNAKRQYALNRQLITTLEQDDAKRALALIHAGADPNTPQIPPPAPTLRLLLDQLLHRSLPTAGDTRNALMMVCGNTWYTMTRRPYKACAFPEDLSLIQAMLAHGAKVETRDMDGWTALHYAALDGRLDTVGLLVQHGANVNSRDEVGDTGLEFAVERDCLDVTRLLLAHGANPNVQDEDGETPLHHAIRKDCKTSILRELLAHGADPSIANQGGETPLMLAHQKQRADLFALLRSGRK